MVIERYEGHLTVARDSIERGVASTSKSNFAVPLHLVDKQLTSKTGFTRERVLAELVVGAALVAVAVAAVVAMVPVTRRHQARFTVAPVVVVVAGRPRRSRVVQLT